MEQVEALVADIPEMGSVFVSVGSGVVCSLVVLVREAIWQYYV